MSLFPSEIADVLFEDQMLRVLCSPTPAAFRDSRAVDWRMLHPDAPLGRTMIAQNDACAYDLGSCLFAPKICSSLPRGFTGALRRIGKSEHDGGAGRVSMPVPLGRQRPGMMASAPTGEPVQQAAFRRKPIISTKVERRDVNPHTSSADQGTIAEHLIGASRDRQNCVLTGH